MRPITPKVKKKLLDEPKICCREDEGDCAGRLTLDHTLIFAGKQINEAWAIVWLCAFHHAVDEYQDGGDFNREKTVWVALNRATDEELLKYSKLVNYINKRNQLNKKYGEYKKNISF